LSSIGMTHKAFCSMVRVSSKCLPQAKRV
jgi:hypothetical protein